MRNNHTAMWSKPPIDLATLPREPGVYRMLNGDRKVLYVGKARNLRKRVSSYFRRRPESPRTVTMVQQIRDLNFSVTPSEAEALILEHNLIKQLKPRYNVLLKDSKSYPYILLTEEPYPRLRLYRGNRSEPGEYFGPFPHAGAVHDTLHIMQKIFRIRDCENAVFRNRSRPCMQHQIGRCSAPCCEVISKAEYTRQVEDTRTFLAGRNTNLIRQWEEAMQQASDSQGYERAAMLRDRIKALRSVLAGSEDHHLPDHADAIALIRHATGVAASIGVRRAGRNLGTRSIRIDQAVEATDLEVLQSFFIEHYRREEPPRHILIEVSEDDRIELQHVLTLLAPETRSTMTCPKRGPKRQWLDQVMRSGEQLLASHRQNNQQPAFEALAELFDLDEPPQTNAAGDNAHLGGKQTVAAITYANWTGPDKAHYRRYKLDDLSTGDDVPAGDDYAAMRAVLSRFFRAISEAAIPCPDIMLIDGGRGQLGIATACATESGLHDLKLVGVAKGSSRKLGEETLWPSWTSKSLKPGRHSPALLLIARVRDEAHRFAGSYMRKRKKKSMFKSTLDGIPGIGPAKRSALLKHFGGIEGVKKASRKQLAQAPGISGMYAERIFTALHR
ncbi:MAG: excinuclease ABC subunit UvrC [Mariprofundaceae bacterium]|nr:excinuclease ABC subunit UvrC [Mariprofundaceae bacterium]